MKSGTTSLFRYLAQHPDICASSPKEPQFFSDPTKYAKGMGQYLEYWNCSKHKVLLEASTDYTKYPLLAGVPRNIYSFNMQPLLIYLVRNPFHRIISHYNHSILHHRPCNILDPHMINTSNYYLQLQQYRAFFPDEKILIIDFDRLINESAQTVKKTFEFLGLNPVKINASKNHNQTGRNLFPAFYPKIFRKKPQSVRKSLTEAEHDTIYHALRADMNKFSAAYHFDIEQWGF
jgi:hypothetical protein